MPGTDDDGTALAALAQRITLAGWMLLGGEIGFLLFQIERARSVDGTRFASAWDQRVEVLSFIMLPPNLAPLAVAAAAVCAAVVMSRGELDPWLVTLLRAVAGVSVTMVFIGVASIAEIATRDGRGSELDSIFLRLGGMSLASGLFVACRAVDLHRPSDALT